MQAHSFVTHQQRKKKEIRQTVDVSLTSFSFGLKGAGDAAVSVANFLHQFAVMVLQRILRLAVDKPFHYRIFA